MPTERSALSGEILEEPHRSNNNRQAYFLLVHPYLEHCSTILNPYIKKEVNHIQNIYRQAATFVLNDDSQRGSVSAMINHLHWDSVERRRQPVNSLAFSRCLVFQANLFPSMVTTIHCSNAPTSTTRYNSNKYQIITARSPVYSNALFPRTVFWWNAHPGMC